MAIRASLAVVLGLLGIAAPAGAQPTPAPAIVLDGPTPALGSATGLSSAIAPDGTGGLVYLKSVAGTPHVFVSTLVAGTFGPPVEVDASLPTPSSAPAIGAPGGGALIVAYVSGGTLYVSQRADAASPLSAPKALAAGAQSPSLGVTNFGKAYVAFTAAHGAGTDVRAAYYDNGAWATESTPLNATAADDAGQGSGAPALAAAGDGVAIVAWGEGGHIYTRRVWGTSPSAVLEQADAPLPGCSEVSADEPAVGTGGDSSFAAVAFHETVSCGGQTQSRALVNRLHGSRFDGASAADGLPSAGGGGCDHPSVAVGEYGRGWVICERTDAALAVARALTDNERPLGTLQVNSQAGASSPDAAAAVAGVRSTLIAWQQDPGGGAAPSIRLRYADDQDALGGEAALPAAPQGEPDAVDGLTAGGNGSGEAAVAWVQSTPAGEEIVADQLYGQPGAPAAQSPTGFVAAARVRLGWRASGEPWGPVQYRVSLDGAQVGQTAGTSLTPPTLAQGGHTWQVSAVNRAGRVSGTATGSFFVDTVAPELALTLGLHRRAGVRLFLHAVYTDAPPPLAAEQGSGIASVIVHWGDGTAGERITHWRAHVYPRPGRYAIRVLATDRAGNETVERVAVTIQAPRKRKRKTPGGSIGHRTPGRGTPSGGVGK